MLKSNEKIILQHRGTVNGDVTAEIEMETKIYPQKTKPLDSPFKNSSFFMNTSLNRRPSKKEKRENNGNVHNFKLKV